MTFVPVQRRGPAKLPIPRTSGLHHSLSGSFVRSLGTYDRPQWAKIPLKRGPLVSESEGENPPSLWVRSGAHERTEGHRGGLCLVHLQVGEPPGDRRCADRRCADRRCTKRSSSSPPPPHPPPLSMTFVPSELRSRDRRSFNFHKKLQNSRQKVHIN
jgi:hypothetical protein